MLIQPQASTIQRVKTQVDVCNSFVRPPKDFIVKRQLDMGITKIFKELQQQRSVRGFLPSPLRTFLVRFETHGCVVNPPAMQLLVVSGEVPLGMVFEVAKALSHVAAFRVEDEAAYGRPSRSETLQNLQNPEEKKLHTQGLEHKEAIPKWTS